MKLIGLNFGHWNNGANNFRTWGMSLRRYRIQGYKWTPFIIITFHKIRENNHPANTTAFDGRMQHK